MLNGNEILKTVEQTKQMIIELLSNEECGNRIIRYSLKRGITDDVINEHRETMLRYFTNAEYVYWDVNLLHSVEIGCKIFAGKNIPAFNPNMQVWITPNRGFRSDGTYGGVSRRRILEGLGQCKILATLIYLQNDSILVSELTMPFPDGDDEYLAAKNNDSYFAEFVLAQRVVKATDIIESNNYPDMELAAAIEFMYQPFIEKTSLNRVATFSGAHIQGKRNDAKRIQIVYLRRREQHTGNTMIDAQGTKIDWSCQWLVQGHWRNQYHPSDQSHKPMFIQSYVKGPEDKPFKAPKERIFAAVR
jgi:hypothetical protein